MKTCPKFMQGAIAKIADYGIDADLLNTLRCLGPQCAWWTEQGGCAINPNPIIKQAIEPNELEQYKAQLKRNIELLLEEKTGWGRVELKKRLFDLTDRTGRERIETYDIHVEKDKDLPF